MNTSLIKNIAKEDRLKVILEVRDLSFKKSRKEDL